MILLVGPAGAGKSTFAAANFEPSQVLSSDYARQLVSDDASDQTASSQAFAILRFIVARRLPRGRLTVIDATNVRPRDRRPFLQLASRFSRPAVALVFDVPLLVCLERNRLRPGRLVEEDAVRRQWTDLQESMPGLAAEGFQEVRFV
ncbi:MAG: hypothetical protein E6J02_07360 [Chloroflexi bacterium]|nr:MAG: hypothetical protein E6J02_07360 [Chloroflexota bacterium]TME17395.1 MAG: hypothetical protein E6I70_10525 [Chloroflexota bacterium]